MSRQQRCSRQRGPQSVRPPRAAAQGCAAAGTGLATILRLPESLCLPHCSSRQSAPDLFSGTGCLPAVPAPMCRLAHCRNGGGRRGNRAPAPSPPAWTCGPRPRGDLSLWWGKPAVGIAGHHDSPRKGGRLRAVPSSPQGSRGALERAALRAGAQRTLNLGQPRCHLFPAPVCPARSCSHCGERVPRCCVTLPRVPECRRCLCLLVPPAVSRPPNVRSGSGLSANGARAATEWWLSLEKIPAPKSSLFSTCFFLSALTIIYLFIASQCRDSGQHLNKTLSARDIHSPFRLLRSPMFY